MSQTMLEAEQKMTQNGSSLILESADEATALSCDQLNKNTKTQLDLFPSNNNGFFEALDGSRKDYTTNNAANCTGYANENTVESTTELANALLSLSGKNVNNQIEQNMKDANGHPNHCYFPSNIPQLHVSSQSPSPICNNTWMGNSSALIGYPFTYGINHLAHCSCTSRNYPNQDWTRQQIKTQEFPPINSQVPKQKQGVCFPSPFQQPWFLASNAFPANFPSFTPLQHLSKLSSTIQQQQLPQMTVDLAQNAMKLSPEIPQQIQTAKQDMPTPSSVALVAPMILEFNQNSHVQGIPMIYNVNQWLNMPSCKFAASSARSQTANCGRNSENVSNDDRIPANYKDPNNVPASSSSSSYMDPITQLGEAANLILQSARNCAGERSDLENGRNMIPSLAGESCCQVASSDGTQLENSFQPMAEICGKLSQGKGKKQSLSAIPASRNLKNRTCSYCQRVFARPFTLKSHIRRHTKEKPFTCLICQRSFSQSATLENHKLTHTGAKPHQCPTCFKRFAHQTSLKTHLRIHSGEQPYQCGYCQRRFSDGSTLQKHKRTHNGERPFRCLFCEKCFSQSGNMRRHMSTTHKGALLAKKGIADIKHLK